jgi:integrase
MTALRLEFIHAFKDRHGRVRHYFRRHGKRTPLPGLPGSAEFMAAYQAALDNAPAPEIGREQRSVRGSTSAAVAEYYQSHTFRALSGGTPAKRRAILEKFREQHGDKQISGMIITRTQLDRMPPHAARNWLKTMRHFTKWCVENKLMRADPTAGIKVQVPHSDGHHTWTDDEIAQFEARHPIGSKARLALALGIYTGQRRSDVVRMGRQHVRDGAITVRQEKTKTPLALPMHPDLQAVIAATPGEHLTFLVTKAGKSYNPNDLSEQFRKWCDEAELPERCVFHGLRKAAARRLAEAGCSPHEIAAVTGHKTLRMVEHYTKAADQERLARQAMVKNVSGR